MSRENFLYEAFTFAGNPERAANAVELYQSENKEKTENAL